MINVLFVGLGGALGAVCRYLISLIPLKGDFPFLTLFTNLLGAVLIGIVDGIAGSNEKISKQEVLFFKTGVCGGFTTFSTFSLEGLTLLEGGKYLLGTAYIVVSVVFCLLGVAVGKYCSTKMMLAITP